MTQEKPQHQTLRTVLLITFFGLLLALVFVLWVYPEIPTATYAFGTLFLINAVALAVVHRAYIRSAMKTRNVKYGTNVFINVLLVLCILVVINILNFNQFYRKDFSVNKTTELSEQTIKLLKELKSELKVTIFDKFQTRENAMNFLRNYIYFAGSKLKVEFVDIDRELTRANAMKVHKYGTVIVEGNGKENRIDELTEEKLTNAFIRTTKDKTVTVCFIKGHGEREVDRTEADGYSAVKQQIVNQTYEIKSISLTEEPKIPDTCSVVAVIGPYRAFLDKEVTSIKNYLDLGGRAIFALEPNLREGKPTNPELVKLLEEWFISINHNLLIAAQKTPMGVIINDVAEVTEVNQANPIMKEMRKGDRMVFPAALTVEIKPNAPATLQTYWLAKSSQNSFVKNDFAELKTGKVKINPAIDKPGPHTLMVAVDGKKDMKATTKTRIVAMGSASVGANQFSRFGANVDLFVNSISWLVEDDSLISIRKKEEDSQKFNLSEVEARFIQYLIIFIIPGASLLMGGVVWYRRRRL